MPELFLSNPLKCVCYWMADVSIDSLPCYTEFIIMLYIIWLHVTCHLIASNKLLSYTDLTHTAAVPSGVDMLSKVEP